MKLSEHWSVCGSMLMAAGAIIAVPVGGCTSDQKPTPSASAPTSPAKTAQCDLNAPAQVATQAPAAQAAPAHDDHALHNLHKLNDRVFSGAVPEGAPAFDELKRMGVKTIISVDGASPDVPMAQDRGMRYVHIPVTYADVSESQRLEIARAIRDLPGPIYVHCHHGKHRAPAATASAAVALGMITPEEGVAFMKSAGTAPNYQGLYSCVATGAIATAVQIDAAPADFPAVRQAQGMVAAMVEVDVAYDNLGEIRAAGWAVPNDHPDLVPAAEAGRLADNFRFSMQDPKAKALGADYERRMIAAIAAASAVEEGIVAGLGKDEMEAKWKLVAASCKDCHAAYRDKRAR